MLFEQKISFLSICNENSLLFVKVKYDVSLRQKLTLKVFFLYYTKNQKYFINNLYFTKKKFNQNNFLHFTKQ